MTRILSLAFLLAAIVGCRAIYPTSKVNEETAERAEAQPSGRPLTEVKVQKPTPAVEESRTPEPITLALECLERGDNEAAVRHLKIHVARNSDQVLFRAQLAELLTRLNRFSEAKAEFETAISAAQDGPPVAQNRLVHYHTRLMEIARELQDEYSEHLHRGIGLHLVACQLASKGESDEVERLQCKAAAALKEAQSCRPEDARAAWYLYQVWSKLDQPRPAEKALRKAIAAAPFSELTPIEARELSLVSRVQGSVLK